MKPDCEAHGFILQQSMMFIPLGADSPVGMWTIISLLLE